MSISKILLYISFLFAACDCTRANTASTPAEEKTPCDKENIFAYYLSKYGEENSTWAEQDDPEFEGFHVIRGVRDEKVKDSVFVLPPLNYEDMGDSYYFCDTLLPRLQTDSFCAHPYNLFTIEDIDEDGLNEVVIFHSACSSRYKSLRVYRLYEDQWQELGASTFDILTQDPEYLDYSGLVKKINKNRFEMCNFDDGRTYWDTININKQQK